MLKTLSWGLPPEISDLESRPSDEILETSYSLLSDRLDTILQATGDIVTKLTASQNAKDLRAPKGVEGNGHPMMRPVIQKAVARALQTIVDQELLTFNNVLQRLAQLQWKISSPPWTAVFNVDNSKMITAKENVELLEDMVRVHLAPTSKAEIARVRKEFKEIRQKQYPISQEQLEKSIVATTG
jgi:hypothetical protein